MSNFGTTLRNMREKAQMSQKALAEHAGLDASHLNRVERGLRSPPKQRTITAIASALMLGTEDTKRLLVSAGHLKKTEKILINRKQRENSGTGPVFMSNLGGGQRLKHPTLQLIEDILVDQQIPVARRRRIAKQIENFSQWLWHEARQCRTKQKKKR
jgi:transcriptional regulator with XRE-family HTH domain